MNPEVIRLPEALKRTGVSRSTWLAGCKAGRYPRPIKLSERAVGWLASDIERFLAERVAARDAEQAQ
jgi:prophage regulatory protein